MPDSLIHFITSYGYLAIFSLVFLQEIGVPNPVPNELVLLFSGSLGTTGTLSFPLVFLVAVLADILGTTLLYIVFYFFGSTLLSKLPISEHKVNRLRDKISTKGYWGIFVGRLIPFIRGYTSVAAGLLRIKPRVFIPCIVLSGLLWSGGYVIAGRLMGKYWEQARSAISTGELLTGISIVGIILFFVLRSRTKHHIHK